MNEQNLFLQENFAVDNWKNKYLNVTKFNIIGYIYYNCDSLENNSWQAGWYKKEGERKKKER